MLKEGEGVNIPSQQHLPSATYLEDKLSKVLHHCESFRARFFDLIGREEEA